MAGPNCDKCAVSKKRLGAALGGVAAWAYVAGTEKDMPYECLTLKPMSVTQALAFQSSTKGLALDTGRAVCAAADTGCTC